MVLTLPVKMEPFLLNRSLSSQKSSSVYVWKSSKYTSADVSISSIVIKKCEDKPYEYKSVQRFVSEYTLREVYPWFPTTLTKNTFTLKIHSLIKNCYPKHFCNIFPTKTHLFHRPYLTFLIRSFSLYQKNVTLAFIKRIVDHFYHKCATEYWLVG